MTERDVKIVVAEGPSGRKGLLRFVLESEGYHVVGEASSSADLARALETHHPDVVVLDDGIGATAVGMTHDLEPAAKVILVWPEAVVPIGGDAAVEPSSVLRRLGPAVERLTGVPSATGRMGVGTAVEAAGILSLGAILAMGRAGGSPAITPADIPEPAAPDPAEPIIDDRGAAPVLILPEDAETIPGPLTLAELVAAEQVDPAPAAGVGAIAGVAALAGAAGAAGAAGTSAGASSAARNRRIGTLALGGAALAGSLVLALALSGSRVPTGGVRGEAPSFTSPPPVTASPVIPPPRAVAIPGALLGDLGGGDTTLTLVNTSAVGSTGPRVPSEGSVPPGGGGGGNSGDTPTPPTGGSGGGNGGPGSGGGGGGSGGSGGSGGGGTGTGGGSGGSTGGGALLGDGGDGRDGGDDACVPGGDESSKEDNGNGENAGQPCETDDDGLDDHHHDDGDDQQGDGGGDHGYGGGDQQGDGDQGDGCDEHDGSGDHGHEDDGGDGESSGYGDSGDHGDDQGDGA